MNAADSTEVGLRQRKKRARRAALVEAAQVLVLERGLDNVTVEDIAAKAGVSGRTFFNYFESKDEAVLGLPGTDIDPDVVDEFVAGGPSGDPFADLVFVARSLVAGLASYKEGMKRSMALAEAEPSLVSQQVAWFDAQKAAFATLLERRLAAGAAAADGELGSGLLMLLLQNVAVEWGRAGCTEDPESLLDDVIARLAALVPPGQPHD